MGTEIILVRHAVAFERDSARWPDDGARPLTPEGKRKFRKAAAGIAQWLPRVEVVLTSPLIRARQTADLLTDVARWPKAVETAELAADSSPEAVLGVLRRQRAKRVALVGHEPHLSELLAVCVIGNAAHAFAKMKKGGVACVLFPAEIAAGKGELSGLMPPKALRQMA